MGGSLLTCATSQGETCHLDISDSLQGLAVSGITTGVSGGVGELNIETKTSSQFVNTLTGVAANKLTTLAVNSAGDALHERKIDPYTAMGGVGLQDVTGLLGALGQDVHAGVKSQHLIDNGWDSRNAIMHTKLKVRSAYLQRELIQAKKDSDTDKIETLKQQMTQYNREMNVIENNEGVPTTPIPAILLPAILPRKREEVVNGEVLETDPKETDDEVTPPDVTGEVEQEEELIEPLEGEEENNGSIEKEYKTLEEIEQEIAEKKAEKKTITGTGGIRGEFSDDGAELLSDYESTVKRNGKYVVYDDKNPKKIIKKWSDVIGTATIAFGHVVSDKEFKDFINGGISHKEALNIYKKDIQEKVDMVNNRLNNYNLSANQHQFDAFVIHAFNTGEGNKRVMQTIAKGGDYIETWKNSFTTSKGEEQRGLPFRRKTEYMLYNTGIYKRYYK